MMQILYHSPPANQPHILDKSLLFTDVTRVRECVCSLLMSVVRLSCVAITIPDSLFSLLGLF